MKPKEIAQNSSRNNNLPSSASSMVGQFRFLSPAWEGALWKLLSCAAFAGINAIVRYLGGKGSFVPDSALPPSVMQFFQNLFGTLFLLPWIFKTEIPVSKISWENIQKNAHLGLHLTRVIAAVLGIGLLYLSFQHMSMAEAVALSFTGPVFTLLGAKLFLGEALNFQKTAAILLSLIGAFIISRPDLALLKTENTLGFVALLPLSSAIVLAISKLLTRKLANLGETPENLAFYLLILMTPVSLISALYDWTLPSFQHWPWLLALGALAGLAHLSFGKAYKLAEVTFLTPFGFSKFLFTLILGILVFSEIPSPSLWLGISVISLSIGLLAYRRVPRFI